MAISHQRSVDVESSAITTVIEKEVPSESTPELKSFYQLALQVRHNLQYEHQWSYLTIHLVSPITNQPLPRPLISGLPPKRLYIHPDEQVELLKAERERKNNAEEQLESAVLGSSIPSEDTSYAKPEPEWVLPTHLREKWSLRRMAEVFDAITHVPPDSDAEAGSESKRKSNSSATGFMISKSQPNKWRSTKRIVLATLSDDSTVVYYIIHDGLVKPRQN